MQERIRAENFDGDFQLPSQPVYVSKPATSHYFQKPQSRISPQIMNLKVTESRKRNRLQDSEDVNMDGSSFEGSGSQEETTTEENIQISQQKQVRHMS